MSRGLTRLRRAVVRGVLAYDDVHEHGCPEDPTAVDPCMICGDAAAFEARVAEDAAPSSGRNVVPDRGSLDRRGPEAPDASAVAADGVPADRAAGVPQCSG